MLVPLAWLILAGPAPAPTLCVDTELADDLLTAIRARIQRREVLVVRCRAERPSTWRLRASKPKDGVVRLELDGEGLRADRDVPVGGMSPIEILQTISLTAVEAVRPSIDALLGQLAPGVDPPVVEPECPPPAPCPTPCPECPTCPEPPTQLEPRFFAGVMGGPRLGADAASLSGYFELQSGLGLGAFGVRLHVGAELGGRGDGLELWRLESGLTALWMRTPIELGLRVASRVTAVRVSDQALADQRVRAFWSSGFGVLADLALWRWHDVELGLTAGVWVWPQPDRFLVGGRSVFEPSHLDVSLGPRLSYSAGREKIFSNRSSSDQLPN
ncbi:MAG: hypothetical protein HY791_31330 [Deltaproteobacteria bacterium]|nr:hypothetical protein [Deltaproteobacteria bacterium]